MPFINVPFWSVEKRLPSPFVLNQTILARIHPGLAQLVANVRPM